MSAPVVAAYDQTPYSKRALDEAVREAVSRGSGLRIVHAYTTGERLPMGPFATVVPTPNFEQTNRRDAEEILEEAAAQVKGDNRALAVETRAVPGDAPDVILAEASTAAVLVVGSRGRGGFSGLLLGSTSQRVLADAPCPVIVTHDTSCESKGQITVGLDTDQPCDEVLAFAFDTAARHDDEDGIAYEQAHTDRLNELLDPWQRKHPDIAVDARVYTTVTSGMAGSCLVEASTQTDLLIVGMRSESGHRHANQLGPVTHTSLHHAHCPVAVVPSSDAS